MEEDAGKLTHVGGSTGRIQGAEYSLVDYNRAGVPLVEIVTKPIFGAEADAPELAKAYVSTIRDIVLSLGISEARMERGNLRCDANVSLRPRGAEKLGTRTETKNVNSLRSIERAVRYEIQRQAAILAKGGTITQETRHWHEDTGTTSPGRPKSDADDYRYFPEPDLLPVEPSAELIEELRAALPEPPAAHRRRLKARVGLHRPRVPGCRELAACSSRSRRPSPAGATPASARKWWTGEIARLANAAGDGRRRRLVTPAHVAELIALVEAGDLTDRLARQVLEGVIAGEGSPQQVVEARGLAVVSDDGALIAAIDEALAVAARRAREDPRRQGAGRRRGHRCGHEGDARQGGCCARARTRARARIGFGRVATRPTDRNRLTAGLMLTAIDWSSPERLARTSWASWTDSSVAATRATSGPRRRFRRLGS